MKLFLVLALLVSAPAFAGGYDHNPGAGDEDPFPLMCADFAGAWRADSGERYVIQQRNCSWLRMQMYFGSEQDAVTIVPDNRMRPEGPGGHAQVRHRWNSPKKGTVLESHRYFIVDGNKKVTEVTMFESVSDNLLLETVYRAIELPSGKVRHEYEQQMFRRNQKDVGGEALAPGKRGGHPRH